MTCAPCLERHALRYNQKREEQEREEEEEEEQATSKLTNLFTGLQAG
jgi:ribosomal protein L12E/L44/L45/RPP1/RPP2